MEDETKYLIEELKTKIKNRIILNEICYWYDVINLIYFIGNYVFKYIKKPIDINNDFFDELIKILQKNLNE